MSKQYKDMNGQTIKAGDCICIQANPFIVESSFIGLYIKIFTPIIEQNRFKPEYQNLYGKHIVYLEHIELDDVRICDIKAYPECFI